MATTFTHGGKRAGAGRPRIHPKRPTLPPRDPALPSWVVTDADLDAFAVTEADIERMTLSDEQWIELHSIDIA